MRSHVFHQFGTYHLSVKDPIVPRMKEVLIDLASAALGVVFGLIVPWVKWQVDKQRDALTYRKEHIKTWRVAIDGAV